MFDPKFFWKLFCANIGEKYTMYLNYLYVYNVYHIVKGHKGDTKLLSSKSLLQHT